MLRSIYKSFLVTIFFLVILCGIYPAIIYGVGQVFFRDKANGGIIKVGENNVGAVLIGQGFSKAEYFHSRPSSAGDKGYDASNSSGSNLGPTNQKLFDAVKSNADSFLKDNPAVKFGEIPVDMVTASASGLDPHISPEAAVAQSDRVAGARKATRDQIVALVEQHVEAPQWGIFGEPVVNVLLLNMDLNKKFPLGK